MYEILNFLKKAMLILIKFLYTHCSNISHDQTKQDCGDSKQITLENTKLNLNFRLTTSNYLGVIMCDNLVWKDTTNNLGNNDH